MEATTGTASHYNSVNIKIKQTTASLNSMKGDG
jgi:hypothetical protein